MKYLFALILFLTCSLGYCQTEADIAERKITIRDNSSHDTTLFNSYGDLIWYYYSVNMDSAKFYLNDLNGRAKTNNSNYLKYLYHLIRASVPSLCDEEQTTENTFLEFEKIMEYATPLEDKKFLIKSYLNLGKLHSYYYNISKADSFAVLGQNLALENENWELLAHSYYLLGNINRDNQNNLKKSIQYFLISDSIYQKHNIFSNERAVNLIELGDVFVELNDTTKAENYYNQAKKVNETLQLEEIKLRLYIAFAKIDMLKENYENAIEKIKTEHAAEIEKLRTEREAETKQIIEARNASMIKEAAQEFASKNFIEAPYGSTFIAAEISKRLTVEEVSGQPVVRVVNADGTPSTASLDSLQKEFLDNKEYSPIIKGKAGSGGGAIPGNGGGATGKSLAEMNATEEAAFAKADPDAYNTAVQELEA